MSLNLRILVSWFLSGVLLNSVSTASGISSARNASASVISHEAMDVSRLVQFLNGNPTLDDIVIQLSSKTSTRTLILMLPSYFGPPLPFFIGDSTTQEIPANRLTLTPVAESTLVPFLSVLLMRDDLSKVLGENRAAFVEYMLTMIRIRLREGSREKALDQLLTFLHKLSPNSRHRGDDAFDLAVANLIISERDESTYRRDSLVAIATAFDLRRSRALRLSSWILENAGLQALQTYVGFVEVFLPEFKRQFDKVADAYTRIQELHDRVTLLNKQNILRRNQARWRQRLPMLHEERPEELSSTEAIFVAYSLRFLTLETRPRVIHELAVSGNIDPQTLGIFLNEAYFNKFPQQIWELLLDLCEGGKLSPLILVTAMDGQTRSHGLKDLSETIFGRIKSQLQTLKLSVLTGTASDSVVREEREIDNIILHFRYKSGTTALRCDRLHTRLL